MQRLITYLIRYPIWVTVLMSGVLLYGVLALSQMRYSFFPESQPEVITVEVVYPGASPEEVEEGVILKIEENIDWDNNYMLSAWRGEWNEFYCSWNNEFSTDEYGWDDGIIALIIFCIIGIIPLVIIKLKIKFQSSRIFERPLDDWSQKK